MFCGKCGKELNENGVCPVCDAKPVVEEAPIKPMEKFESSSDGFKPLVSAAWFAPVALVGSGIVGGIISGIIDAITGLISSELYSLDDVIGSSITNVMYAVSSLISAVVFVVAIILTYKIAFKTVDPDLKKKSELIIFVPFFGTWLSGILSSVIARPISGFVYSMISAMGDYSTAYAVQGVVITIISAVITLVVAAGLFILSKKILAKIEEK